MILTILKAQNGITQAHLDGMAERHPSGTPFIGEDGRRIGTVLRIWREGDVLKADVECVPEDIEKRKW